MPGPLVEGSGENFAASYSVVLEFNSIAFGTCAVANRERINSRRAVRKDPKRPWVAKRLGEAHL